MFGQLGWATIKNGKLDSPCWDSTSLEGAMVVVVVVVVVVVELSAMGFAGRSMDSESCSTGDKTAGRSESFLLTRSMREGRVTSLGRKPSMQLSRLNWRSCSRRPPAVTSKRGSRTDHNSHPVLVCSTLHETDWDIIISFCFFFVSLHPLHHLEIYRLPIPVVRYSSQVPLRTCRLCLSSLVCSSAENT